MKMKTADAAFRQIIARFRDSDNWDDELDLYLMQTLWPRLAGRYLGESTSVIAIEEDTVLLQVPDQTWSQQLASMRPLLVRKINEAWPGRPLKRIRFTYEDYEC